MRNPFLILLAFLFTFTGYGQSIRVSRLLSTGDVIANDEMHFGNGMEGTNTFNHRGNLNIYNPGIFTAGGPSQFQHWVDHILGVTNRGVTPTSLEAPVVIHGSFAFPPVTNANPWVVTVTTNTLQRNVGATNGTVSFSGTAVDGVRIEYHKVNTGNTNYDITIPSSLSVAQALTAVTSVTCNSNSLTKLIWTRVSGAWHLSVEKEDDYTFAMTGVAIGKIPKVTAVEPKIVVGWDDDATAAGGAAIRVQSNTVVVGTVTNINFLWNASDLSLLWTNNGTTGAAEGYFALAAGIERKAHVTASNFVTQAGIAASNVWDSFTVSAGAWTPSATNPAVAVTNMTGGADYVTQDAWEFDDTTLQSVELSLQMPMGWDLGDLRFEVWGSSTNTIGTNIFGLKGKSVAAGEDPSGSWGTEAQHTAASGAVPSTAGRPFNTATVAVTVGGTPAAGEWVFLKLSRKPADASDNLIGKSRMWSVVVHYQKKLIGAVTP